MKFLICNRLILQEERCSTFVERPPSTNKARNQLIIASVICLFFTTAEAVGKLQIFFSNYYTVKPTTPDLLESFT